MFRLNRKYLFIIFIILTCLAIPLSFLILARIRMTTQKPLTPPKGTYTTKKNADLSYDYFYRGTIIKVIPGEHAFYSVIFQPLSGSSDQTITISIFKVPPKFRQDRYGRNIQEMFNKNIKKVYLRIGYDKKGRFLDWEILEELI